MSEINVQTESEVLIRRQHRMISIVLNRPCALNLKLFTLPSKSDFLRNRQTVTRLKFTSNKETINNTEKGLLNKRK